MASQSSSLFKVALRMNVRLSPYFTQNMRVGVENLLNKALLKYLPEARGILLAYEKLRLVDSVGLMVHEGCETHFQIQCDALVFRIKAGTLLEGTINKVSSNHIGLLVHGLFNASIAVDELRNGMSFDVEAGHWYSEDLSGSNRSVFRVGTKLLFKAVRVRSKSGLVFIAGTQKLVLPKHVKAASALEKIERRRQAQEDAMATATTDGDGAADSEEPEVDEEEEKEDEEAKPPPTKKAKSSSTTSKEVTNSKPKETKKKKKEKKKKEKKSKKKSKSSQKKRKAAEIE